MRSARGNSKTNTRSYKNLQIEVPSRKLRLSKSPSDQAMGLGSTRTLSGRSIGLSSFRSRKKEETANSSSVVVEVQNKALFSCLSSYPLRWNLVSAVDRSDPLAGELLVVSRVQDFYEQYKECFAQVYSQYEEVTWLMLSNAVNNQQNQQEFNQTYSPLKFVFKRTVQQIVNTINFNGISSLKSEATLRSFERIVNFQAVDNDYACIFQEEQQRLGLVASDRREMWMVSRQGLMHLKSQNPLRYYFLSPCSFSNPTLVLHCPQRLQVIYILTDSFNQFLHSDHLKQLQSNLNDESLKRSLMMNHSSVYHHKVITKYLLGQPVYCMVSFPEKTGEALARQLPFSFSSEAPVHIKAPNVHVFNVYYGKIPSSQGLSITFNPRNLVKKQANKIQNFGENIIKNYEKYKTLGPQLGLVGLFFLNFSAPFQLIRELSYFGVTVHDNVQSLWEVVQSSKERKVIIGILSEDQKAMMNLHRSIAIISQEAIKQGFHQTCLTVIKETKWNESELTSIGGKQSWIVTSFDCQLQGTTPGTLRMCTIQKFDEFLDSLKQGSKQLLIFKMEDYLEERQVKLKQKEKQINVQFQVYLSYGTQFIMKNKSKYTFFKTEQLIQKINSYAVKNEQSIIPSFLVESKKGPMSELGQIPSRLSIDEEAPLYSTPLVPPVRRELMVLLPKMVPWHSLINRAVEPYHVLVYSSPKQVQQLLSCMENLHYAAIFTHHPIKIPEIGSDVHYEVIHRSQLGQKIVRNQLDALLDRQGFIRQATTHKSKKDGPAVLLWDQIDQSWSSVVSKMKELFGSARIIAMTKRQFKNIKKSFPLASNLVIYELGKPQIPHSLRPKSPVDIFKLYMCPFLPQHEYTPENLTIPLKQLLIKQINHHSLSQKMSTSRLNTLTKSRSQSPKGRTILTKQQLITQSGLIVLQSQSINKISKKQSFKNDFELLGLCYPLLSQGKVVVIILTEEMFDKIRRKTIVSATMTLWLVITEDPNKAIIREKNVVFSRLDKVDHSLSLIAEKYRSHKQKVFTLKDEGSLPDPYNQMGSNEVEVYIKNRLVSQSEGRILQIIKDTTLKECHLHHIRESLVFNSDQNFKAVKQFQARNESKISHLSSLHHQERQKQQCVYVLCQAHNKQFIKQSLKIVTQSSTLLITFESIYDILSYSQHGKSLLIVEKQYPIQAQNVILVEPSQTALSFSKRLNFFIEAVRRA